jgi:hypothetical protein
MVLVERCCRCHRVASLRVFGALTGPRWGDVSRRFGVGRPFPAACADGSSDTTSASGAAGRRRKSFTSIEGNALLRQNQHPIQRRSCVGGDRGKGARAVHAALGLRMAAPAKQKESERRGVRFCERHGINLRAEELKVVN